MFNPRPRKTSIPIHFHFAHSKRSTPSPNDIACDSAAPVLPKKRPTSILIPHDTPDHQRLPTVTQPEWTPVEIANFPPHLRRADLLDLLRDFTISPSFNFPDTPRFTRPFRTTVLVAGLKEAMRMVKELDKNSVAGREISVKMAVEAEQQVHQRDPEEGIQDVAEELKNNIINTARIYYPDLSDAILVVRELVNNGGYYAFLQQRVPVTIHSDPNAHSLGAQNIGDWEFVAGAAADSGMAHDQRVPRLKVLKSLQEQVEMQGVLSKIWGKWGGR
ncbi:hypothetical protein BU23DRAFT_599565 [Bimuria novae-zelandiae CBS 107.79]|uniref:Uncharacterized protein n=1 Tax=Bimuria novae-zelandiae CBS 107.79 TaxID=1447943 RepID=A0A6A5V8W7_9PLEO|nr:hypothetical protein BU23DRAFT_599565 [Bimuria novae-zelandiae CBS 107.79]